MAPSKNTDREVREARDRLRRYNARQAVHTLRLKRRRRDNVIAVAGLVLVAALATTTQVFYFTAGPGIPVATATPTPTATDEAASNIGDIPSTDVAEARTWTGTMTLNDIALGVSLDGAAAPQAVASVVTDAQSGYYTGKTCNRLALTDSLSALQCGSLGGDGVVDPSYSFGPLENVPTDGIYPAGTIAMARGESAYSQDHQFFIVLADSTLGSGDDGYTVVGTVTSGLDTLLSQVAGGGIADGLDDGTPLVATTITGFTVQ